MATDLGIEAWPPPTPTTRYRAWRSNPGFLLREIYFYNHHLLTGQQEPRAPANALAWTDA